MKEFNLIDLMKYVRNFELLYIILERYSSDPVQILDKGFVFKEQFQQNLGMDFL